MTRELNIICEACDKPIRGGDNDSGDLWVGGVDLDRYRAEAAAWKAEHTPDPNGFNAVGYMAIVNYPEPARWRAHHEACDTTGETAMYNITPNQLRTWADLVEWTAHLMEKTWLDDTNWRKLLEGAAAGTGPLLLPLTKPVLST